MPCFGPLVRVVYPPTCDPFANRIVSSDFVEYNGDNLSCTGIQNCDTLTIALQKIDNKICSDAFVAQIIQTIANDPVLLAYFCQLVSSCSPTTTTTSTTVEPTTTTTTTSSTSTTTTTTTIACATPTLNSVTSDGFGNVTLDYDLNGSTLCTSVSADYSDYSNFLPFSFGENIPDGCNQTSYILTLNTASTQYIRVSMICNGETLNSNILSVIPGITTTTTTTTIAPTTTTTTTTISPLCNDFILDFDYSFADANNTLNIIFDGFTTIPAGFYQDAFCDCCDIYTNININDGEGATFETGLVNIPNLILANTPYTLTNLSTYFNEYTDAYNVTVTNCITNGEVSCTKITSMSIPNPITRCPVFTVTPNGTAIDFGFTPTPTIGATYYVRLRNGDTNAILSTQTFINPLSPVSSSFTGLTIGVNYKVQLELFTTNFGTDDCETVNITPL